MQTNRIQDILFATSSQPVEVISVHASWWPTRVKQGVHVLNPDQKKLEQAKELSKRLGTNTVYVYEDKPSLKPAPRPSR